MSKLKLYLWIFYINIIIGTFTFGGGYVVIPMIKKYYIDQKSLFSEDDLMEMAAIAQSSPGAIAINLSVLVGQKTAGYKGAIICFIASILPSIIILSLVSSYYELLISNESVRSVLHGMQACVGAMIVNLIIDMIQLLYKQHSKLLMLQIPVCFILNFIFNINAIALMLFCVLFTVLFLLIKRKQRSLQCS